MQQRSVRIVEDVQADVHSKTFAMHTPSFAPLAPKERVHGHLSFESRKQHIMLRGFRQKPPPSLFW